MSFVVVLFAPLVLLPAAMSLPAPPGEEWVPEPGFEAAVPPFRFDRGEISDFPLEGSTFQIVAESFRVESGRQVRIEQHTTIRIAPRTLQAPPNAIVSQPRSLTPPRMAERNIGRCVPAARISGVQVESGNRLILFLRDRRVISAELDRTCRSRDFYSGFYLEQSADGQLCAGRDTLLSRNGANCRLNRIRQLVDPED